MRKHVLVINGPNLNYLGRRETSIYGSSTLNDIVNKLVAEGKRLSVEIEPFQSSYEGAIVDAILNAKENFDGVIINAGALSHYSYAIRDAITCMCKPCIEVHMSNIYAREEFRHTSVLSPVCTGVICGLGEEGYILALTALARLLG